MKRVLSFLLSLLVVLIAVVPVWAEPPAPPPALPDAASAITGLFEYMRADEVAESGPAMELRLPKRVYLAVGHDGHVCLGSAYLVDLLGEDTQEMTCAGFDLTVAFKLRPLDPGLVKAIAETGTQHVEFWKDPRGVLWLGRNGQMLAGLAPDTPLKAVEMAAPNFVPFAEMVMPTVNALGVSVIVNFPFDPEGDFIPYRDLEGGVAPPDEPAAEEAKVLGKLDEDVVGETEPPLPEELGVIAALRVEIEALKAKIAGLTVPSAPEPLGEPVAEAIDVGWIDPTDIIAEAPKDAEMPPGKFAALRPGEIASCAGEGNCVYASRDKGPYFYGQNPTSCQQHGWRWDEEVGKWVTGIPAKWVGPMLGFTYRPCSVVEVAGELESNEYFVIVVESGPLNVRERPGADIDSKIIGQFKTGQVLYAKTPAIGDDGKSLWWELVNSEGDFGGFVSGAHCKLTGMEKATLPMPEALESGEEAPPSVAAGSPEPFDWRDVITVLEGNPNVVPCGDEPNCFKWNSYEQGQNSDPVVTGGSILAIVACRTDGEIVVNGVANWPIPGPGTYDLKAFTARPCPPAN